MPKLSKDKAQAVNDAEGSNYDALPADRYVAELADVSTGEGPAGPYWSWEFKVVDTGLGFGGRKLWLTTSLSQDWAVKRPFEAFGVEPDTDTDELIGECCVLMVSQREIQKGNRKGQIGNNVDDILALGDDDVVEAAGGDADDEDVFG